MVAVFLGGRGVVFRKGDQVREVLVFPLRGVGQTKDYGKYLAQAVEEWINKSDQIVPLFGGQKRAINIALTRAQEAANKAGGLQSEEDVNNIVSRTFKLMELGHDNALQLWDKTVQDYAEAIKPLKGADKEAEMRIRECI